MRRYDDTAMSLDELGVRFPGYRPTYAFGGEYVDAHQAGLAAVAVGRHGLIRLRRGWRWRDIIARDARDLLTSFRNRLRFGASVPGWLMRAEALKLYELAYYAPGDVLELGSYHGLSTAIMALAIRASPTAKTLHTADIDPACVLATVRTLRQQGLTRGVTITCEDATALLKRLAARQERYSFIFVDHSHAYEDVLATCQALPDVVLAGGLVLFHDYNNPDNRDPSRKGYGVYQAVHEGLDPRQFEFYGVFGSSALYRARESTPAH